MYKLINDDCLKIIGEIVRKHPKPIIIVTDPPFNIGYHYKSYKDKMGEQEYFEMLKSILTLAPSVVIHYPEQMYKLTLQIGSAPNRVVSWVYNSNTTRQHREIAFWGVTPDFNAVRQPYKNLKDKRIQKRIAEGKSGAKLYDWWNVNQVKNVSKDKTDHPCQMPLEVMKNIIGILPPDATILDPFMGSGTTGVACLELGRDFIGIEMDTDYFAIAARRMFAAENRGDGGGE